MTEMAVLQVIRSMQLHSHYPYLVNIDEEEGENMDLLLLLIWQGTFLVF
jgi:hypothetical protein